MSAKDRNLISPLYLALDQGGHSSRAIVTDPSGAVVAKAQVPISANRYEGNRIEQDALELADSLKQCCHSIAESLGNSAALIQSAGLATQRSSIVCWEKSTGAPLTPVLSWQDRRASSYVESLAPQSEKIKQITGLVLSPHYGASKLRWCLRHSDSVQQANKTQNLVIGPLASFLVRQLTENATDVCDPANASRTQLWNRWDCDWSSELCDLFDIEQCLLPKSVSSKYRYGNIQIGKHAAPIELVTGDQSAAIYAFGKPAQDVAYVNLGTGAFIQHPIGRQALDLAGMLNSVVYQDEFGPEYVVEGTVNGAGSALSWFAKQCGKDSKKLVSNGLKEAEYAEPPVFLNGISGLGSPFWISDFESGFLSEASDNLKAVGILESIAFLIQVNIERMSGAGQSIQKIVLTGGLSSVDYLCQAIADICEVEVERSSVMEATSAGVAYLLSNNPESLSSGDMQTFTQTENKGIRRRAGLWHSEMHSVLGR